MKVQTSPNGSKNRSLGKKIDFEYYAPQARQVKLAGGFNGWNAEETPLKKDHNGTWRLALNLPAGRYEYRYLVDGSWQNDQRPVECVPNSFGSWNCVVEVH